MDIEWGGEGRGIALAQTISSLYPDISIIFITSYMEKYVQNIFLYPLHISGFLIKPVDEEILRGNLKKIQEQSEKRGRERFYIKQKGKTLAIRYDEILYLESAAHKVFVHTKRETWSCYDKLDKLAEHLPDAFVHCHKSYLVNMGEVCSIGSVGIKGHAFLMTDGKEIPISKSRYGDTKKRFFEYTEARTFPDS